MIDIFALSITHGLLALAAIRLFARDDLDHEGGPRRPFGGRRKPLVVVEPVDDQP